MTVCSTCSNVLYNCSCTIQEIVVQVPTPTQIIVGTGQGGARGVQGIQGVQGISGVANDVSYQHVQGASSAIWTITHNLNFYPNITTMDSAGAACEGEIEYLNRNTVRVTFSSPFSGEAYLS